MNKIFRKIIHIDMDAFYASVEQLDNPEIRGKPVIVGGKPDSRGVVAACSYESRKFGIHSAMPCARAYKLCPDAIFVMPRFDRYKEISQIVHNIFHDYTDLIEPLSLDEAFLDVTENKIDNPSATLIAEEIRKRVYEETGLTCSAGISFNKFIAKVASDVNKPNGIKVVTPDEADQFIDTLPIRKFFGIGKVTEERMKEMGILSGADLKTYTRAALIELFGKVGNYYYEIAHGLDRRKVNPFRERKSVGAEKTLQEDITDKKKIWDLLLQQAERVERTLKKKEIKGKTVTVKVKYYDFEIATRSITLDYYIDSVDEIMQQVRLLLKKTLAGTKKIRLLGITVSSFEDENMYEQLKLPFKRD